MTKILRSAALLLSLALAACATAPPSPSSVIPTGPGASDPRTVIVDRAKAMLGQPYRYGGGAPGGFDCSGLAVYATVGAGVQLPRTASEQIRTGTPVSRSEVRAGDLVFMRLGRRALHVGIAIDDSRFIHAPAARGFVRIDSLEAQPYRHGFVTARRIVGRDTPPARSAAAHTLQSAAEPLALNQLQ